MAINQSDAQWIRVKQSNTTKHKAMKCNAMQ